MTGDDELFEELRRLVSPPFRQPPPESVAALHASVARQFGRSTRRRWWHHRAAVGAALFGLVAGAPAAAFAISGTPLPDPLRTAMYMSGLPVDSVPVADTKAAEVNLEHALRSRDGTEIDKAAAHLETCLAELDGSDRARLAPRADALLRAATSDIAGGQQTLGTTPGAPGSGGNPSEDGGTARSEQISGSSSSSNATGSTDGNGPLSPTSGSSGLSGDGDGSTTAAPTTDDAVPPISGSGDGSQAGATPTTVSQQGPPDNGATTTTLQTGGNDGGGGSSSVDGGSGGETATTTTTNPSH